MARPPNRSGLPPPNSLGRVGVDYGGLQKRAQRTTVRGEEDLMTVGRLQNEIDFNEEVLSYGPPADERDYLERLINRDTNRMSSINSRMDIRQRAQVDRISELTMSQNASLYSSRAVNGQAMDISRTSSAQNMSMSGVGTPWEILERRKGSALNTVASLGVQAARISEGLYNAQGESDPRKVAELQRLEERRNAAVNVIGVTEASMRYQRSLGMDPQSRYSDLLKTGGKAGGLLAAAGLAEEVRGGGVNISRGGNSVSIASGDINKALDLEARNLTETLRRLQKETDTTSDSFKTLKTNAEESAANFEKLSQAAAMGGGGASGSQKMAALAGGFNAAAGAAQEILVNQRLGQVSNITGFANIENQKYNTYRTASQGNIMSQLQMGAFGGAEAFGRSLSRGQLVGLGLQTAGGVAQAGAGYAQMVEGGAQKNPLSWGVSGVMGNAGNATNEVLQGGLNMAQGASTATTTGFDIARGVSTSAVKIQGVQAYMEATKALSFVGAEQLQGFRDYGVGASVAAQGMGSAGAGFVNRAVSGGNLQRMIASRIGPEQFNQMAQFGVANMGSTFNENQIFASRGLERSGMGTMQENMQRMASLASAGSNNPQAGLTGVLEAAVSRGLDSSKAINMVVDHTAAMAGGSVGRAMGLDTTAAASAMLTSMVGSTPNKEAGLARAASLQETIRDIGTNRDMSFSGMVATARISRSLGIGGTEAISAQGIDTQTLRTMSGLSPAQRSEMFRERGINVSSEGSGKMVDTLLDDRAATLLEGKGVGFAIGGNRDKILQKIKQSGGGIQFKDLSKSEQLQLGQMAGVGNNFATGSEVLASVNAVYANNEPNAKRRVANDLTGAGGSDQQKTLDDMRTQGFKQLSQAALEATKGFKDAATALQALGTLAKGIEAMGDKGYEGEAKTAAARSAESFGKDTAKFADGADKIWQAAKILAAKAGLSAGDDPHANREASKLKTPAYKISGGQRG